MANEKISELPSGAPAQGADALVVARAGSNYSYALSQALTGGGGGGGGLDVQIGGNTAGVTGNISTGTLFIAGGNNITLSQAGNAVTISGPSVVPSFSAGVSGGNTSGITGVTGSQIVFAGGNGVTLSQSNNTAGASITISAASQTIQTQNVVDITLGGNTSGALALISSGTLFLAGGNNVTLSQAGNSVTISANTVAAATLSVSAGASTGQFGGITFSNSNGFSFGLNNGTITAAQSIQTQATGAIAATGFATTTTNGAVIVGTLNTAGQTLAVPPYITTQTVQTQNAVDVSLGGNTAGALALISSGTLFLAGGNNVTLSQNGNSVTISANTAAAATLSISAGSTSSGYGGVTFSNSNNVSFGLNNGTITANAIEVISAGASTGSFSGFTLSNANNVSFGMANGTITASASQSVQTQPSGNIAGSGLTTTTTGGAVLVGTQNSAGLSLGVPVWITGASGQFSGGVSNIGNFVGNTGISGTQLVLAGGNNITLSQVTGANGATVTVSGGVQSNQTLGLYASSQTVGQASSSTIDARSFSVVGRGNISVGLSAASFLVSGSQSAQSMGIYASSQTTGQASSATVDARSFTVVGAGIISVGMSQQSLLISAPGSTGISQSVYATGNTVQSSSGTTPIGSLLVSGAGNVSVGMTNGTMVISGGGGGGGGAGAAPGMSTFGNTAGTTGTFSSGTYVFVGTGPISLSQSTGANGATLSINGPAISSISGSAGINVSVNGSTISVYPFPLSRMIWPSDQLTAISAPGQGSISIQYVENQWPITATRLDALVSWAGASAATTATMGIALSAWGAIFIRNGASLSQLSSGSAQTTYTYASNSAGQLTAPAIRPVSVPMNILASPFEYFVAFNFSTAATSSGLSTTNLAQTLSMMGGNNLQTAANYAEFTQGTAAARGLNSGMGVYSATSAGIPATIALADVVQTGASLSQANIALVFRNI